MAKPVFITLSARDDLDNVLLYLAKQCNHSVLENFLALYEAKISLIAEYPTRYPFINENSFLRKAVLTKHNFVLYREKSDHIEIISIFDTRPAPEKLDRFPDE